jgi:arabinose-5-phosphate isomerase
VNEDTTARRRLNPQRTSTEEVDRRGDADLVRMGRSVLLREGRAVLDVGEDLGTEFATAVRWIYRCRGRVLIAGLGKSGLVARKIAATMTGTGTPALFVHPVEALHGDLGIATADDLLLAISRSGENSEILALQRSLAAHGLRTIALTCEADSELARRADLVLATPIEGEACPLHLSPTTSTTAALAMGDALAMTLLELREFRREDFALFHPSGALGRALRTRVEDLMHAGEELPLVPIQSSLRDALLSIAQKRLGCTCVVSEAGELVGFVTDGDLKRALLEEDQPLDRSVTEFMSDSPRTVSADVLARDALHMMESDPRRPITQLVVVEGRRPVGLLHLHDILRAGLRQGPNPE